jgi:hypothetical protein
MKVVIITVPIKSPEGIYLNTYPMDGNKSLEYGKDVRCPINGILAKTLKKGEQVKFIYIMTTGEHSHCELNKETFIREIEDINAGIGAVFSYDTVEIEFSATKQTYNKLITDLADKIPENAELFVDYTFGSKPEILSLFCALRFAEEFCDAVVQFIVYGKVEFISAKETKNPMLYDSTSLYYLFKLMGTMRTANAETASKLLKDFFAI